MPVQQRALVIGMMGPVLQALGLIWLASHMLIMHWSGAFTARHLLYQPGMLLVVSGLLVTFICVPVALEVARANDEEVKIPLYEPAEIEEPQPERRRARRAHYR